MTQSLYSVAAAAGKSHQSCPTLQPRRRRPTRLPSLGLSRQEHWSGLPFPPRGRASEVAQSCPTLRAPMDCSLPGSSVHGISRARVLEWLRGLKFFKHAFTHVTPPAESYLSSQYCSTTYPCS